MIADPILVLATRPNRSFSPTLEERLAGGGITAQLAMADSIGQLIGLPEWATADAIVLDSTAGLDRIDQLWQALTARGEWLPVYLIGDPGAGLEAALVESGLQAVVPPDRLDRLPVYLRRDIQAKRSAASLRETEHRLAELTGDAFFHELAAGLSASLGLRWTLIGELELPGRARVTGIAAHADGVASDPRRFRLAGEACEAAARGETVFLATGAGERLLTCPLVQQLQAVSCYCVPLSGTDPLPHGLIVLLDDKPMDRSRMEAVVARFAARAGAELERRRIEDQRTSLQAQLVEAQKMEALGTLAGGIAHDFNNILMAILGNTEMARDEVGAWHPASGHLSEIIRAAHRARDVVQRILTFSRKREPQRRPLAPRAAVNEVVTLLRATLPATIDLVVDHSNHPPDDVLADPNQIHQVLMNVVTNAAHAIGDRPGTITIREESVVVDRQLASTHVELTDGPHVRISVTDTGAGMDRDTLARIFEPFFTTKPPGEGTGLGLAVVHGIIKEHDGAIVVTSTPNRGSCFQFYFPVLTRGATPETPEPLEVPRGNGQHILLVDDEAIIVRVSGRMLERLGYRVTACSTARAALEFIEHSLSSYRLIISDLTMPEMTGLDLAERAKRIDATVPVLLTSGHSEVQTNGRPNLVDGVLTKPFTSMTLARAVHRLIVPESASPSGQPA